MKKKLKLTHIFFWTLILAVLLSVITVSGWQTFRYVKEYREETEKLGKLYTEMKKWQMKREVERTVSKVDYELERSSQNLKDTLKERVYKAYDLANHLYNTYRGKKSKQEIIEIIKESLRPVRYGGGEDCYFIADLDGNEVLYPLKPEVEGTSVLNMVSADGVYLVKEMIKIARTEGEGFITSVWNKMGVDSAPLVGISFVKLFEPFNWYIGLGDHINEQELRTKTVILDYLSNISFGNEGEYKLTVTDKNGHVLLENGQIRGFINPQEDSSAFFKEKLEKALDGGGFLNDRSDSPENEKVVFVKAINTQDWIIEASFPVEDVNRYIATTRNNLRAQLKHQILDIVLFTGLVLLVFVPIVFFVQRKLAGDFRFLGAFLNDAIDSGEKIDRSRLIFRELDQLSEFANKMLSDKEESERDLRDSEEMFRTLASASQMGISLHKEGKCIYANPAVQRVLGFSEEELKNIDFVDLVHPDFKPVVREREHARFEGNVESKRYEIKVFNKNGEQIWIDMVTSVVKIRGENLVIVSGMDVSDRKRALKELERSKKQYEKLFDSAMDALFIVDEELRIIDVNQTMVTMFGLSSREEALSKNIQSDYSSEKNPLEKLKELNSRVMDGETMEFEWKARRPLDGTCFDTLVSLKKIQFREKDVVLATVRDITRQKQIEEELLKVRNLESLGVLAGGLAHDFNNLLAGVFGNISLIKMKTDKDSKLYNKVISTEKIIRRAIDLTDQLLTFSKGGDPVKQNVNVGKLVKESAEFSVRGSKTKLSLDIPENLYSADVDEGQISQVITNLVINASHAMPDGGNIKVSVENFDNNECVYENLESGLFLKIDVEDEGTGIDPDNIEKIFDPYFTTKKSGNGLGLASAYSIVKKHNGMIDVKSEIGKGTVFSIFLPADGDDELKPDSFQVISAEQSSKGYRILFMDDEEYVREMASEMLEELGHSVNCTDDGQAAYDLYKIEMEKGQPFDLVIMDLTVPGGLGGREALELIREYDTQVKALVSSGYSNDPVISMHRDYGFSGFIKKPYLVEEMAAAIENVMKV